jgi:Dynein heavy chain, N-terminal region 2
MSSFGNSLDLSIQVPHASRCSYLPVTPPPPRFYFISDDELLSILASGDPTSVQEHMLKLFDNCAKLTFGLSATTVTGMTSSEARGIRLLCAFVCPSAFMTSSEACGTILLCAFVCLSACTPATLLNGPWKSPFGFIHQSVWAPLEPPFLQESLLAWWMMGITP